MCGIAVIAGRPDTPVEPSALQAMVGALRHRGPDEQSVRSFRACGLGHARLSIIDIVGGAQPMSDPGERYWIVFNGEIYNFRELRQDLESRGHSFRTRSDTEVLLNAYRTFGRDTPRHLNGQFAFAIWDRENESLFGARDRMGEKPLFWAEGAGDRLLMASEIRAILASGHVRPEIDPNAVDAFLGLNYVPPDRTIYRNIHVVPPAHSFLWQRGRMSSDRYWSPPIGRGPRIGQGEAVAHIRSLLDRAVERQMIADVPLGAFLSGGLDSTTIVALMSKHSRRPVKTFSVGFGRLIDELPYARAVADQYGTEHHEIQVETGVGETLETMSTVYDEPFSDSSNIPTYLICGFARKNVTVALSGDGGDEVFGGYSWYLPHVIRGSHATGAVARAATKSATYALRAAARFRRRLRPLRDVVGAAARGSRSVARGIDPASLHLAESSTLGASRAGFWLRAGIDGESAVRRAFESSGSLGGVDRAVDFDINAYLPGDILVKVDRASMAHSLESRAPFLDVDLVEFVLSLPASLRFAHGDLKRLLRAAAQDLWPPLIRRRSKQGFGAPVVDWLSRPDVAALAARVGSSASPLRALLPGVRPEDLRTRGQTSWSLLCLGLWLERRSECLHRLA